MLYKFESRINTLNKKIGYNLRKRMKILFSLFLLTFILSVTVAAVSKKAVMERMKKNGQSIYLGKSEKNGNFIVCMEDVSLDKNGNPNEARELLFALAKKRIAAFLGQTISATREMMIESKTINKGGVSQTTTMESFKSFQKVDISQILKGIIQISIEKQKEQLTGFFFVSEKTISAADVMKKAVGTSPNEVIAVGMAMLVDQRLDVAKKQALNAAMRQAIEQVLGTQLASTTQVQDNTKIESKIFSNTSGFIEKYRVLDEGNIAGCYRIKIVAKVAKDKLMKSYSSLMKSFGDPYFYVECGNKEVKRIFTTLFINLGLKLINTPQKTDYIIKVTGHFDHRKHPIENTNGVQLSLWIIIRDAHSGQELLSVKNDPTKAAVFYSSGARQKDIAAKKAFNQVKKPFHKTLNSLIASMATQGREVRVVIENYSSAYNKYLTQICKAIEMVPGCSNVNMKIDKISQTVEITANYNAKMDVLEKFLKLKMQKNILYKKYIPETQAIKTNDLVLSY
jgi:hypothetical protein